MQNDLRAGRIVLPPAKQNNFSKMDFSCPELKKMLLKKCHLTPNNYK
jgi:hypothetical protein